MALAYVCHLPPFLASPFPVIKDELAENINEANIKFFYYPVGPWKSYFIAYSKIKIK